MAPSHAAWNWSGHVECVEPTSSIPSRTGSSPNHQQAVGGWVQPLPPHLSRSGTRLPLHKFGRQGSHERRDAIATLPASSAKPWLPSRSRRASRRIWRVRLRIWTGLPPLARENLLSTNGARDGLLQLVAGLSGITMQIVISVSASRAPFRPLCACLGRSALFRRL